MSEPTKAVFLSYASQDAEAAKKICDALRAAGVEVWFDQSELVGGDAWDAKIRKQIAECALFVPVISANTQARREGYFRLEWKVASQRTHMIADGTPFLLPLVIDDTRDAEALVPAEFKAVQWTRLPAGETPPTFCSRVKQLLTDDLGRILPTSPPAGGPPRAAGTKEFPRQSRSPRWLKPVLATAVLVAAVLGVTLWRRGPPASPASATTAPSPAETPVAKAWALLEDDPLMTRANVELAEQIGLEVLAKNPTDAEANAVTAWANFQFLLQNYDDAPQRGADLKKYAEKAHLLAPDSLHAELAQCGELLAAREFAEAGRRLQALADRYPGNLSVLRTWAWAAVWGGKAAWGTAADGDNPALARLRAASPLGRDYADTFAAGRLWARGDYLGADRAIDEVFAHGQPVRMTYLVRLLVLLYGWGDLPAARRFADTIPAKLLLEDVFICHVAELGLRSGDYEGALATLARTPRELLHEALVAVPTAELRGDVLAAAGRPAAAAIQWAEALKLVNRLLESEPGNVDLREARTQLLADLGDAAGAGKELALLEELDHATRGSIKWSRYFVLASAVGDLDGAIARLDRAIARDNARWPNVYNQARSSPSCANLRADPRTRAIFERGAAWLAALRAGSPVGESGVAPATANDKSVAVLAFANLSDDKENEYFSDGISEELLNQLGKVPGLRVAGRASAFSFKGRNLAEADVARALGVAYLVDGSVQRAGSQVRITARLVNAADGFQMWSEKFTRDLKDIFAVQDEIAGLIAQNLQLRLGASARPRREVDPEAYRLSLEGRQFWNRRTPDGFAKAEAAYREAVRLDPKFAEAYAGLACVYVIRSIYRQLDGEDFDAQDLRRGEEAGRQALVLDPDSADAEAALGYVDLIPGRLAAARTHYERALALNPKSPVVQNWYALLLAAEGRLDEALAHYREAEALDPLWFINLEMLATSLGFAHRFDAALATIDRAIALRADAFMPAVAERARYLLTLGRRDEAVAAARQILAQPAATPRWSSDAIAVGVLRQAGLREEAQAAADRLFARWPERTYLRGFTLAALGRFDDALPMLALTPAIMARNLYWETQWDPWRKDPRFAALLAGMGRTEELRRARQALDDLGAERGGTK